MLAVGPANPVGFFPSWPGVRHTTELLFQMEGGVEMGPSAGEESGILIEVRASEGEAPGDPVEAGSSGSPLPEWAARVEVLL